MRKLLLFLAVMAPLTFGQTSSTVTYSYSGLPIRIFPDSWDTVSAIRLFVPRAITIQKVTATVQVQYSGVGDLNVFLYSAQGTRSKLLERNCGSLVNINATFDDSAPQMFNSACPSAATLGTFRGNEPLGNANGQNSYGYWRLAVENNGSDSVTGFVTGFSISITGLVNGSATIAPGSIVDAASFKDGAVAPGEMIGIFGYNLGPTTPVQAPGGSNLPTTLGGTTVTFDGASVPIFYASDQLVVVQAPNGLTPGGTTAIQVSSTAGPSQSTPVSVVPARPGLFTYESGPQGQVKAINQDGTLNGDGTIHSTDTGAPVGSIIQVFASGLGVTNPALQDGVPAGSKPLPMVVANVNAVIAGQQANVSYAGAAPGLVGVYQVNIEIPRGTPRGAQSIVISSGGNLSQDKAVIQIK
jgi:uncharacterized protein (TIGR03437 family)